MKRTTLELANAGSDAIMLLSEADVYHPLIDRELLFSAQEEEENMRMLR